MRGITAAGLAKVLVAELPTRVARIAALLNRVRDGALPARPRRGAGRRRPRAAVRPHPDDPAVGAQDTVGVPLVDLPSDSPVRAAVASVAAAFGLGRR